MLKKIRSYIYYILYFFILVIEASVLGVMVNSMYVSLLIIGASVAYMDCVGEAYSRYKMRAELIEDGRVYDAFETVKKKLDKYYMVTNIKIYYVPGDNINAFSFGRKSIGITAGAANLDKRTVESLIAHEIGHSYHADMFFYRYLFMNLLGGIVLTSLWNSIVIGIIVILIITLFVLESRLNFVTYSISKGVVSALKRILNLMQRLCAEIFRAIIFCILRRSEYHADTFATVKAGYGEYLKMFLRKYSGEIEKAKPRSLLEMIYDSHPASSKRILNIEKRMVTTH